MLRYSPCGGTSRTATGAVAQRHVWELIPLGSMVYIGRLRVYTGRLSAHRGRASAVSSNVQVQVRLL
ncbi:MAG: hypothetical protein ACK55Z_07970 [bacterium]